MACNMFGMTGHLLGTQAVAETKLLKPGSTKSETKSVLFRKIAHVTCSSNLAIHCVQVVFNKYT